ncbi:hypothetical protein [Bradyrhizobium iriomotense]|uniref:Uncharacterized protein n=1 Tax=Bradyrhizobium iriomotense TaxID=441950 RepID=A0ABQ6AZN6_9BRAD|nr:hypothetical protein [Bradyrhizobium iriomotense]GLR86554.1 hypothetical protein GCM10007857_32650 [Bradyrhizobium iriomotense]
MAIFGGVDIVATAGKIISSGRTKLIQPLETGVVRAINVHEGRPVLPATARMMSLAFNAKSKGSPRGNPKGPAIEANLTVEDERICTLPWTLRTPLPRSPELKRHS